MRWLLSGANKYQFEFVKSGYLRRIASPTSSLNLTVWATSPLQYGFTYDVKVRVSFDNGANYCPFGAICQITTAAGPENPGHGMETSVTGEGLQLWPNPNGEGRVYLHLEGLSETTELVTVDIYDLMGSKVQTATLVAGAGVLNESLDLSNDIARGVYVVNLDRRWPGVHQAPGGGVSSFDFVQKAPRIPGGFLRSAACPRRGAWPSGMPRQKGGHKGHSSMILTDSSTKKA